MLYIPSPYLLVATLYHLETWLFQVGGFRSWAEYMDFVVGQGGV